MKPNGDAEERESEPPVKPKKKKGPAPPEAEGLLCFEHLARRNWMVMPRRLSEPCPIPCVAQAAAPKKKPKQKKDTDAALPEPDEPPPKKSKKPKQVEDVVEAEEPIKNEPIKNKKKAPVEPEDACVDPKPKRQKIPDDPPAAEPAAEAEVPKESRSLKKKMVAEVTGPVSLVRLRTKTSQESLDEIVETPARVSKPESPASPSGGKLLGA